MRGEQSPRFLFLLIGPRLWLLFFFVVKARDNAGAQTRHALGGGQT
jgi:hypothetical protein